MKNDRYKIPKIELLEFDRGNFMQTPEDVSAMLRLHLLGWGIRKIARELRVSKNTVKKYIRNGGWKPYRKPNKKSILDGLNEWLKETFFKHRGNADVVRQELQNQHNIKVSLRTVERAVKKHRNHLKILAKSTVRFETSPGKQLQIDFGTTSVNINNKKVRIHLFVAVLGFSRRSYVEVFHNKRQRSWFNGIENSFRYFNGIPDEILLDNDKSLVTFHNPKSREVIFNKRFLEFASYWNFAPKACAPYRARTKGKDENGVKYVKNNAIAGHSFKSWEHLQVHLNRWLGSVADVRIHGTTGQKPIDLFNKKEIKALNPLNEKPPFNQLREITRKVNNESCIEIDTNYYSVPWNLIGSQVLVQINNDQLNVLSNYKIVASHFLSDGFRQRVTDDNHFKGIISTQRSFANDFKNLKGTKKASELLRPLSDYESLVGGSW